MAIGDQVGKYAVDELTVKTVPELLAGLMAALQRLDGATITVTIKLGEPK